MNDDNLTMMGALVPLHIKAADMQARLQAKAAGGRWDPEKLLWFVVRYNRRYISGKAYRGGIYERARMRTELRRKERAIKTSREMELLLERMPVGRLAVTTKEGPYIIAVNYLFFEGSIYFHSGLAGRKMEALRADSRVCFMVDEIGPQVLWEQGCGISQIYKSVICFGKAEFVEGQVEKGRILGKMVQKYVPSSYARSPMKDQNIKKTAVVRIVIEFMSGKENALSPEHTVINNPSL